MADKKLRRMEAERNKLWAEARLKGLPKGSPERDRIDALDAVIRAYKATLTG